MFSIEKSTLPDNALLARYAIDGTYTDCYSTVVPGAVAHPEFVNAFYTTFLFRVERLILKLAVSRPSTDADVERLAAGQSDTFAAWRVEARAEDQLLLCDFRGRTRSWLMVAPIEDGDADRTRLYFGSAVVPVEDPSTNQASIGLVYRALLGFHKLYSIALLRSARSRCLQQQSSRHKLS